MQAEWDQGIHIIMSTQAKQGTSLVDGRLLRRRRVRVGLLLGAGVVLLAASAVIGYIVDALWFDSLGLGSVFWTRLNLQAAIFATFALVTFLTVYGMYRALVPDSIGRLLGNSILIKSAASDAARRCHPKSGRPGLLLGECRPGGHQYDAALDHVCAVLAGTAQCAPAGSRFSEDRSIFICLRCPSCSWFPGGYYRSAYWRA